MQAKKVLVRIAATLLLIFAATVPIARATQVELSWNAPTPMRMAHHSLIWAVDNTVSPSTTYGYTVSATDSTGGSPSTATQYITTPAAGSCPGTSYIVDPVSYWSFFSMHAFQPGDTVHLAAGDYDTLSLYNINGTAACPIVVTGPSSGPPAVILGDGASNTVRLQDSSYLIVRHL